MRDHRGAEPRCRGERRGRAGHVLARPGGIRAPAMLCVVDDVSPLRGGRRGGAAGARARGERAAVYGRGGADACLRIRARSCVRRVSRWHYFSSMVDCRPPPRRVRRTSTALHYEPGHCAAAALHGLVRAQVLRKLGRRAEAVAELESVAAQGSEAQNRCWPTWPCVACTARRPRCARTRRPERWSCCARRARAACSCRA